MAALMTKPFETLKQIAHEAHILESLSSLLNWDEETYMPPGAISFRGDQHAYISGLIHKKKTGPEFKQALYSLVEEKSGQFKSKDLSDEDRACLRVWYRNVRIESCLPESFVKTFAKKTSEALPVWREAKEKNRFDHFLPHLKTIIKLAQEKANYIGYEQHPYDALLDLYEEGLSVKETETLFTQIKDELKPLIQSITSQSEIDDSSIKQSIPQNQQMDLGKELLKYIGYSFNHGRLDISAHPFSSCLHPTDSRITTRIDITDLSTNILAILHEAGHSFYDMGLPKEHYGTPLAEYISMGIHESQSRFWETCIGQSKAFWEGFYPILQRHFQGKFDTISLDTFYQAINKVTPSFTRVEADEVTYPMHVILRFELEKELISNNLQPEDIPEAWNQKMEELLGIKPENDRKGCLQDIHWAMGAFGYFPSYLMGNVYAGCLFKHFRTAHPGWESSIKEGRFDVVHNFLNDNVYKHGHRYSSHELIKNITSEEVTSTAYIDYLKSKYLSLVTS